MIKQFSNILKYYIFDNIIHSFWLILLVLLINLNSIYAETLISGSIKGNVNWIKTQSPFIITGNVEIDKYSVLNIEAGCIIKFNSNAKLSINGRLIAIGNVINKIQFLPNTNVFTSHFWQGIEFKNKNQENSSILKHVIIQSTGKKGQAPIIVNSNIFPIIENIELKNNLYNGIEIQSDTLNYNLRKMVLPYLIFNDYIIQSNKVLKIYPGVVIKLYKSNIIINGEIESVGKYDSTIVITSIEDDSDGIDSNCDAYSTGYSGGFGGILLTNKSQNNSRISYTKICFGGASPISYYSLLAVDGAKIKIEYSFFENSKLYGVSCISNSIIDLGLGVLGSDGFNTFIGFNQSKYAIFNRSTVEINAINNCWYSNDTNEINKLIYDKNDSPKIGITNYNPICLSCSPSIPSITNLLFPENESKKISINTNLNWEKRRFVEYYQIQIDTNILDENSKITYSSNDTFFICNMLNYSSKYYWRVQGVNYLGFSEWSNTYCFYTVDTSKPKQVSILSPINKSTGISINPKFKWSGLYNSDYYHVQIAKDTLLDTLIVDTTNIISTELHYSGLLYNNIYYWRVRAINNNGYGEWSEIAQFRTKVVPYPFNDPPASWDYQIQTGSNSAILFRLNIEQSELLNKIKYGDAIGNFFLDNNKLVCAGYVVWDTIENKVLVSWGDNNQTINDKDGFDYYEKYNFKLWDATNSIEHLLMLDYESGTDYFLKDTLSIIKSIKQVDTLKMILKNGEWCYISSYLVPYIRNLKYMFLNNKILLKTENDSVFSNSITEINGDNYQKIEKWDFKKVYHCNSFIDDTVYLIGTNVINNDRIIALKSNQWVWLPFYFKEQINVEDLVKSINQVVIAIINSKGQIYSPILNYYNNYKVYPGEGLIIVVNNNTIIDYNKIEKTQNSDNELITKYYKSSNYQTEQLMGVTVVSNNLSNGDEIAIIDTNNTILGAGLVYNNVACFSVWGANISNDNNNSFNGKQLKCKLYSTQESKEYSMNIVSIFNYTNKNSIENELSYKSNNLLNIIANKHEILNIDNCDYNDKIEIINKVVDNKILINYTLNQSQKIKITAVDILGNKIEIMNKELNSGKNKPEEILINNIPTGLYLIHVVYDNYYKTTKILVIK